MASTDKRTITLSADRARYVDALVASGKCASESDVISAGVRALQEREAGMERWLREEVLPVYDAMQADPGWAIPAPQVTASLDALHAERLRRPGIARSVVYAPEAVEDLLQLYRYIAEHSGPERARGYPAWIEAQCLSLAGFPER